MSSGTLADTSALHNELLNRIDRIHSATHGLAAFDVLFSLPLTPLCAALDFSSSLGGNLRFDHIGVPSEALSQYNHACFQESLDALFEGLRKVTALDSPGFERSKSIRDALSQSLNQDGGWVKKLLGVDSLPSNLHNQNYIIDFACDLKLEQCAQRHRLLVEIGFDNRQAVGTNIFKLETAASNFREKTGGDALGILICGERKALNAGGWDSGVADEEEYQIAIGTAYRSHLTTPISLVVLRA